ncbi:MAG: hypothetical protein MK135_05640 [Polyangiaceae bacterium]|nr:hypothetical protein [Polyangiaceae bacterium]
MLFRKELNRYSLVLGLLGLSTLPLSGCGGKKSSDPPPSSAEQEEEQAEPGAGKTQSCKDFCSEATACDSSLELDDCQQTCSENELLSQGAQTALTNCTVSLGCDAGDEEFASCLESELEQLAPTASGEELCEETLTALLCDEESADPQLTTACLESVALVGDGLLSSLNECGAIPVCELAQACAAFLLLEELELDLGEEVLAGGESNLDGFAGLDGFADLEDLLSLLDGPSFGDFFGSFDDLTGPDAGQEPSPDEADADSETDAEGTEPGGMAGSPAN